MALLAGKLEVQADLKSSSDKYWEGLLKSTELFPKIFPDQYKSIELIEGDGKSVGSIRKIHYGEGIPVVTVVKEKVELMDEEKKSVSYRLIEGELLSLYKSFCANLQVLPNGGGDGSTVKWSIEYEKLSEEVPEPNILAEIAIKTFSEFDEYVLKN